MFDRNPLGQCPINLVFIGGPPILVVSIELRKMLCELYKVIFD